MIRYMVIFTIGLLMGIVISFFYTSYRTYSSMLVQSHWTNNLAYIGPLERDLLYMKKPSWGKDNLNHFIMGMTVFDVRNAVCTRRLLTDFQLRKLRHILNEIKSIDVVKNPYWVAHFSKTMNPVLNGNVIDRSTHFSICDVYHIDSDKKVPG